MRNGVRDVSPRWDVSCRRRSGGRSGGESGEWDRHVGEGNRGDEEVMMMEKFGDQDRNADMAGEFAKRTGMAVVKTVFQRRQEDRESC